MPAKRRRGPKLDYGVYAVARSASKDIKLARKLKSIEEAAGAFTEGQAIAAQTAKNLRQASIARGTGGYKLGRALSRFGAGKFGQALQGAATTAAMGSMLGMGLYTGAGEYTNDLINNGDANAVVPQFALESDEGIVLSKREYVSEIYGPAANVPFSLQSFPLNPGLEGTFPWLSQIAMNYDEYELMQCIFTFKSTTTESTSGANGQVGTIIMATNYNAAAPPFTDKVTMMQYAFSNSERLTRSCQHGVECDPAKLSGSAGEYIRNNPVVTGQDLKTYDHGKFQIAVANCYSGYANVSIGELWVSYTVRLRKPKFYEALGLGITKDIFCSNGTETGLLPLGKNLLSGQQNNLGSKVVNDGVALTSSITITFPAAYKGRLKVLWSLRGTGVYQLANITYATTGNVTPVKDLYGYQGVADVDDSPSDNVQASYSTGFVYILHIDVNLASGANNNSLRIILPAVPTTVEQSYIDISEYNGGFSYGATGITGISSSLQDAPVFINSSGVITVPS